MVIEFDSPWSSSSRLRRSYRAANDRSIIQRPPSYEKCDDLIEHAFFQMSLIRYNTMSKLISCQFNTDTACVELVFDDGSQLSIDCTAVENEVADNRFQRSELDYLIYNDPLAYADLVLNGDPEAYLNAVTDYDPLDS